MHNEKRIVIELADSIRSIECEIFKNRFDDEFNYKLRKLRSQIMSNIGIDEYNRYTSFNKARYQRSRRVKQKVNELLKKPCVWITLTFTDNVLDSTNEETRAKYVKRALSKFKLPYIANIDFGNKNGREHYHALLQTTSFEKSNWDYGFIKVKKVLILDTNKLANYISKFSYHATKSTVGQNYLIYSRSKTKCKQ